MWLLGPVMCEFLISLLSLSLCGGGVGLISYVIPAAAVHHWQSAFIHATHPPVFGIYCVNFPCCASDGLQAMHITCKIPRCGNVSSILHLVGALPTTHI